MTRGPLPRSAFRACIVVAAVLVATPALGGLVTPRPVQAGAAAAGPPEPGTHGQAGDPLDEATVVRDEHGIAHVYADSERALWYANGYTQARDHLWAMDLLRHLSYGEGASVVGPGGGILEMDLEVRRDLYNESQLRAQLQDAPPGLRDSFEAFSDGVNRAAAEMRLSGETPAEFTALQHQFEGWEAVDSAAVATFLLARFGAGGGSEVDNARLLATLEERVGDGDGLGDDAPLPRLNDLNWQEAPGAYPTIPGTEGTFQGQPQGEVLSNWSEVPPVQREATRAAAHSEPFGLDGDAAVPRDAGFFANRPVDLDFEGASNALVVAPSHSESGKAMVGGGPQTGYFNPQILWEVGLHGPDDGVETEGVGVMGAPGVVIARTGGFAWTVTSGISDQTDVVALEATGDRSYTWDGQERELDCRTERHRILSPPAIWGPSTAEDPQGAESPVNVVTQEVCRAHLPVTQSGDETKPYPVVAINRTGDGDPTHFLVRKTSSRLLEIDSSARWLNLAAKENFTDFAETFEPDPAQDSPGFAFTFNFHFAGVRDATRDQVACYKHVGLQPERNLSLDPRLPTPAGDAWNWRGFLAGDDLPSDCNPDQGYYANWNNLPQQGWPAGDSRELWGSVHRVERLDHEAGAAIQQDPNDRLTLGQVKDVLRDAATRDSLANQVAPSVLDHWAAGDGPGAREALADWSDAGVPWDETVRNETGHVLYAFPGFTVYEDVVEELLHQVFADELGDQVRDVEWRPTESSDPHAADHGRHRNKFAILVDELEGQASADWCDDVTTSAQENCTEQVRDALEEAGLTGAETPEDVDRTPERRSPFTSLGVAPAPTMPMTNRATYYHFHVGSDTGQSFATLPPGVSGHISTLDFARILAGGDPPEHVTDQLDLYVNFGFKHLPWTQASAEKGAEDTRTLLVPPAS